MGTCGVCKAERPFEASRSSSVTIRAPLGSSFSAVLAPAGENEVAPPGADPGQGGALLAADLIGGIPAQAPAAAFVAGPLTQAASPPSRRSAVRPDPLDPATRHSAQMAPLLGTTESLRAPATPETPVQASARVSLEEVLPALVRRIAWSGDGKKGSLQLEFGQGVLAGGTLLIHADDGRVRVELRAPPGTDTVEWKSRITSRLERRGLRLDEVLVE